jgi:hypothetical protein
MRAMMGVGVNLSTAAVARKKRMEIRSAFATDRGAKKAWHICAPSVF